MKWWCICGLNFCGKVDACGCMWIIGGETKEGMGGEGGGEVIIT